MKILHINSYYSGSSFYKNLFDKQMNKKLDINVFVPVSSFNKSKAELGTYTTVSLNHKRYDRIFFWLKHHKIYKDLIRQYDISEHEVVHAHSLFSNGYLALKLKQNYNIPYIVAVRNTDVNIFFKYMIHLRKIGIQILQNADKIIFLSKPYKNQVIERYIPQKDKQQISNKSIIVPNGIDDFWFDNIKIKDTVPHINKLNLLYVGVINKNKNIITTINAIRILQEQGYTITFTIIGKIQDETIYNEIKHLSYINYISPKSKEDLIEKYRNNDIFIMPSIYESFGLVYAEAMSQGLPVIYTRGQGFDGQFQEGQVGYSVNCMDEKEIANSIRKIYNNYYEISQKCIELVDKFQWNKISNQYTQIYQAIISS